MAEVIASIQSACASSDSARKTYVFSIEMIRNAFATKCFTFFGSSSRSTPVPNLTVDVNRRTVSCASVRSMSFVAFS